MTKHVKSQLEIYMDELDGVGEEELLPEVENLVNAGPVWGSQKLAWGAFTVCMIVTGIIEDAMCVAEQSGAFCLRRQGTACEGVSIVCARRVIQFVVAINLLKRVTCGASSFSAASWLVYQCNLIVFYMVVLLPVSIGMLNQWLVKGAKHKLQLAQHNTECLLSVIKRVQLVRMGSSISHPMPPVAKLEESFMRANLNDETFLSCREIRNSLHCALVRLKNTICCDHASITRDIQVATVACLERMSNEAFCMKKDLLFIAHLEALLAKLAILKRSYWETIGYRSGDHSNKDIGDYSMNEAEQRADPWQALAVCADCVLTLLSIPLHLSNVVAELDVYLQTCQNISGPLYQNHLSNNTLNKMNSAADQPNNSCHSYADTYLTARQRIARLRAFYDDISTRLWLADQQLSKAPLLQCLLPDPLHTANSDKDDQNDRVQLVDASLETLSHSTRTPSSHPHSPASLTQNDILEGVELLLAGLPTLRDFELLCEDLQLIREASVKGVTPAQCKLDRSEAAGSDLTHSMNDHAHVSSTRMTDGLGESHQQYPVTQGMYEAINGASEALPSTSMSSLDPSHTSNILDVYTTIIPRHATKTKKAAVDPVDAAMAAQERSQAKKLFRELNQHLRRMHQPPVAAEDASSGANQVGVVHVPVAGCYTQQRVRNIGTTEPENGDFADEVEVKIETNFTQVDPSALGLREDSDSESEEQKSRKGTEAEVKTHRVGSMLLTTDELQAAGNLSPSHSVQEFQNEMRQALLGMQRAAPVGGQQGWPLSAFASALRSNQLHEATFGDELSD